MAWFHAVFVGSVTLIKSGTNAVFLAREDPHRLPLLYVAVAIVVWVATSLLARSLRKLPPARVLNPTAIGFAVAFVVVTLACALQVKGATFVLYVLGEVNATVLSVLFWARLSDAFGVRDQKKVVGLISAGGMAGSIVGGLAIRALAGTTGTLLPLAVSAVGVALALPLLRRIRSGKKARPSSVRKTQTSQSAGGFLLRNRYAQLVAALVVLLSAAGAVTDFVFRVEVSGARSEAELAGLFGILNATVGVTTSLFQLLLTQRLLARIGVFVFGGIVPSLLMVFVVVYEWLPSTSAAAFFVLLLLKGTEMAGAFSLNSTVVTLLYNPMPHELRAPLRAVIDGAIKKGGAALAGLALAALAAWAPSSLSPPAIVVPAALCLLMLPWVRTHYLGALDKRLGLRRRRRIPFSIDVKDKVTREAVLSILDDDDEDRVVHAVDVLGANDALDEQTLVLLLHHDSPNVREHALRFVPNTEDAELEAALLDVLLHDDSRRPRAASVRALLHIPQQRALEVLESVIDDEREPGVVAASLEVMLTIDRNHERARQKLDELVDDLHRLPAAWRRELGRALGALDESRYDEALLQLLHDDVTSVRKVAVFAAGRENHAAHLPQLVAMLRDTELRQEVRQALVNYQNGAVPLLSEILDDRDVDVTLRMHIPRVLRDIGSKAAVAALVDSNARDLQALQLRIAEMLVEAVQNNPDIKVDRARTREALFNRLQLFEAYRDAALDLGAEDDVATRMLVRVLEERQDQNLRIGLYLLGIHHGMDRAMTIYRAVRGHDVLARQDALELLDAGLIGSGTRGRLMSVLEGPLPARTTNARAQLDALRRSPDPLLRALATCALQQSDAPLDEISGLRPIAPGALEGDDMDKAQVDRLFVLEHVDLFEGLSVDELAAIASIAEDMDAAPKEVLYREGDTGDALFVVVEGAVELAKDGAPIMSLVEGESLGQTSFLDRGLRPVTATIGDDGAKLMRISRGDLMDLMADRPGLMRAFFEVIGARLRALLEKTPAADSR